MFCTLAHHRLLLKLFLINHPLNVNKAFKTKRITRLQPPTNTPDRSMFLQYLLNWQLKKVCPIITNTVLLLHTQFKKSLLD